MADTLYCQPAVTAAYVWRLNVNRKVNNFEMFCNELKGWMDTGDRLNTNGSFTNERTILLDRWLIVKEASAFLIPIKVTVSPMPGLCLWLCKVPTGERRHNHYSNDEHDGVSNHRRVDGLLHRLFRRRSKKTSKLCVTGLCEGNSLVTGEFPSQRASNAGNISIWRRHREMIPTTAFPHLHLPTPTFTAPHHRSPLDTDNLPASVQGYRSPNWGWGWLCGAGLANLVGTFVRVHSTSCKARGNYLNEKIWSLSHIEFVAKDMRQIAVVKRIVREFRRRVSKRNQEAKRIKAKQKSGR